MEKSKELDECTLCGKKTNKLTPMQLRDSEMCCDECVATFEMQADAEFERQREEGLFDEGQRL